MGKKRKKIHKDPRHTPLDRLKKRGSKLIAPMSELNMQSVSWDRDLLPEHLWIASLVHQFGIERVHGPYSMFLDAMDEFWPDDRKDVCLGLISDFGAVPPEARGSFIERYRTLARELFWSPFGELLSLYPESPAAWLAVGLREDADGPIDPDRALARLRGLIRNTIGGRSDFATRVRILPFGRPLKHGKMFFMRGMDTVDLLPRYPNELTRDEAQQVESFVRASMMAMFGMREDLQLREWPKYFWRHNYELATCVPVDRSIPPGTVSTDAPDLDELVSRMDRGSHMARDYLRLLGGQVAVDLYDPRRDEILFGLFARLTRLLVLLFEEPHLWARDVGSILLRCLADTAITFGYLAKKGIDADFERFIAYGEGQQKLLMLHLQDNYPGGRSTEGMSVEDLEQDFTIMPEFIDVELGHWAGKDARRLAAEAGMEHLYRLVFSPSSSDVHGSWLSLRKSHLTFCEEPLHRFHRLPIIVEPPFFVSVVDTARQLFEECRAIAVAELGYPVAETLPILIESRDS